MTTADTTTALQVLKQISIDRYEQDGGTTYECMGDNELLDLLAQHNFDPEAAWAWQVLIYNCQREVCAAYDND